MLKEIKYLILILIIFLFIFFISRYYFSDINKKNSYRSLNDIDKKINIFSNKIPIIENDTKNIIEYTKNTKNKKKKKYFFWNLISKDD